MMTGYRYKLLVGFLILSASGTLVAAENGDAFRDPTQPPTYKDTIATKIPHHNIKISAIFAGKKNNTVIINNHAFVVGDKIANLVITAIDKDGITLKKEDGSEFRVEAPYTTVKSPTTTNWKVKREN